MIDPQLPVPFCKILTPFCCSDLPSGVTFFLPEMHPFQKSFCESCWWDSLSFCVYLKRSLCFSLKYSFTRYMSRLTIVFLGTLRMSSHSCPVTHCVVCSLFSLQIPAPKLVSFLLQAPLSPVFMLSSNLASGFTDRIELFRRDLLQMPPP